MSFNVNWNLDYYKTDYESEEHWKLRRRFMEIHKRKFPEDELVCLAQVFVNIEFMGCKYPDETMRLVGELSQDVAKEFRENRAKRLKRTFVKASTAAEARAKGKRSNPVSHANKDDFKSFGRQGFGGNNFGANKFDANTSNSNKRQSTNLLTGLPFGNFILYLIGDRNAITISGQRCNAVVNEKESIERNGDKRVDIIVNSKLAGTARSPAMKTAKVQAFENAIAKLQEECFTIKNAENPDRIDITKNNKTIVCSLKSSAAEPKIDKNNIGYKMMQKLGWSGGGLGSKETGREDPVDYLFKNNRRGLGTGNSDINKDYFASMLDNYIMADDIRDLHFDPKFSKDERAQLHQIAQSKNLKSGSRGKDPNRFLIISKKNITLIKILEEVLIHQNPMYINKFEVTVPANKRQEFPEHVSFKEA